jgi:hypothetical protein
MDLYTSERYVLDRHREMVEAAERRAVLAGERRPVRVRRWAAGRLRSLADRLDGRPQLRLV